jgi:tRNA pseudouridine38-40 synthase
VHASGQVVSFDFEWSHSCEVLQKALNALLPDDIAVHAVKVAADDFHPRYNATSRCYHYRIYCQPERNPLINRFSWQVWPPVDVSKMQVAAQVLLGTHDFSAFGKAPQPGGHTIRTIFEAEWFQKDQEYVFKLHANAFLYHMVRRIVFLLVKIGQDKWSVEKLQAGVLEQQKQVPGLAKPYGLSLVEVQYRTPNHP